jgi:hypothetical protein
MAGIDRRGCFYGQGRREDLPMSVVVRVLWFFSIAVVTGLALHAPVFAENVGQVRQELVAGKEVHPGMQEHYGLLTLQHPAGTCSASLLRNGWVITAAHCVEVIQNNGAVMPVPAANITLTANWKTTDTIGVVTVHSFRPRDIALLELDRPFAVHGSTTGFRQQVWSDGPYTNLRGYTVTLFGRGINQFATAGTQTQSDGKYRFGYSRVDSMSEDRYWYPADTTASIAGGDSGGPTFTGDAVSRGLSGVHSRCTIECVDGMICGRWPGPGPQPPNYSNWAWVKRTPACGDAPIEPVWADIRKIMDETAPRMKVVQGVYGSVRYVGPTVVGQNGIRHRLDVCYRLGIDCGQPAADAFCRIQDGSRPDAVKFKVRERAMLTAVLSDGAECDGEHCTAFDDILCASREHFTAREHEGLDDRRDELAIKEPWSGNTVIQGRGRLPGNIEAIGQQSGGSQQAGGGTQQGSAEIARGHAEATRGRAQTTRAVETTRAAETTEATGSAEATRSTATSQSTTSAGSAATSSGQAIPATATRSRTTIQPRSSQETTMLQPRRQTTLQPNAAIQGSATSSPVNRVALAAAQPPRSARVGGAQPGAGQRTETLICRGGSSYVWEAPEYTSSKPGTRTMRLIFQVATQPSGPQGQGLRPSECGFVDKPFGEYVTPAIQFEDGIAHYTRTPVLQAKSKSPATAAGSVQRYLQDESHVWSFDVTRQHGYFEARDHRQVEVSAVPERPARGTIRLPRTPDVQQQEQ